MQDEASIRVRVLQLGRRVLEHSGPPGLTVDVALEATGMAPGPGMELRVDGAPAGGATELQDGQVITIIPRIKGG